ncbi:hypothetical protein PFISCL1PPCAC_20254, partial [Pristionchus fissidentatus]
SPGNTTTSHGLHTVHSSTSLTEFTSASGTTSNDSIETEISIEEKRKKELIREERRIKYRAAGIHVVADEDDRTEFEPSVNVWQVDRKIVNKLQWKAGYFPVHSDEKPKKPRNVKRKEFNFNEYRKMFNEYRERMKLQSVYQILKDAVSFDEKTKKNENKEELKEAIDMKKEKTSEMKDAISLEEKSSKERSTKEKEEDGGKTVEDYSRAATRLITSVMAACVNEKKEKKKDELKGDQSMKEKKEEKTQEERKEEKKEEKKEE